ncbi:MAG: radical SAM protein [Candidatus Omnitrophica bacterium]|nr:radical SAM protein [Candidatus Omnitrophota bacterium]
MADKHYTIPFFVPLEGCPNRCIFCDQRKITGEEPPSPEDVPVKIEKYLATMSREAHIEAGFFGGSFTGLSMEKMKSFFDPVKKYISSGRIKGIRLSTRPDLVDARTVSFLADNGVVCVELGVQSMSDRVLLKARRGHTASDTEKASRLILDKGMVLGHQMMVGLPGSSFDDELYTAERIKKAGAMQARIYPVVVVKGTELARMYGRGEYEPLSMEEAVERSAELICYFEKNGIKVIRCGLHPSEGLTSGEDLLAGPFHVSFGHFARQRSMAIKG